MSKQHVFSVLEIYNKGHICIQYNIILSMLNFILLILGVLTLDYDHGLEFACLHKSSPLGR